MSYPSDLQDEEWKKIAIYFQPKSKRGKPREHAQKDIVNAILYVLKGGITWRMMSNDLPPWQTVYDHFSRWSKREVWEVVLDRLSHTVRSHSGRSRFSRESNSVLFYFSAEAAPTHINTNFASSDVTKSTGLL